MLPPRLLVFTLLPVLPLITISFEYLTFTPYPLNCSRHMDAHKPYLRAPSSTEVCRGPACSSAPAKVVVDAFVVNTAVECHV